MFNFCSVKSHELSSPRLASHFLEKITLCNAISPGLLPWGLTSGISVTLPSGHNSNPFGIECILEILQYVSWSVWMSAAPLLYIGKNSVRVPGVLIHWVHTYLALAFWDLAPLSSIWLSLQLYYDLFTGDTVMGTWLAMVGVRID